MNLNYGITYPSLLNEPLTEMDLKQRKLNKSEWTSIEVPVSTSEIAILNLIMEGYADVNFKINNAISILAYLKLEASDKM